MSFVVSAFNHNGFILAVLIMLPNILWIIWPPVNFPEQDSQNRGRSFNVMEILEGIGRMAVFVIPLFFSIRIYSVVDWTIMGFLILMLVIYYTGWVRFFMQGRRFELLFAPLFWVPIPMAVCPVLFFLAGSWILRSGALLIAAVILGIGHLYISYREYLRLAKAE